MQQRSFRITVPPGQVPAVEALLAAQGFSCRPEPFFAAGRRLTAEPFPLGSSLAAFFGLIYIQDRSSMLPPVLLAEGGGVAHGVCLDMCASPGGKTGILAGFAGPGGCVLAVEASRERLATLRQNLRRTGAACAASLGAEAQKLALRPGAFDAVLLDPPCSGWGTAEKNPRVLKLWTPKKAQTLVRLQRDLLRHAAALLRPGGRLMYSTCTTNPAEDEEQAAWAVSELPLGLDALPPPPGFSPAPPALAGVEGVLRIGVQTGAGDAAAAPAGEGQGFFLARFRRKADAAEEPAAVVAGFPGGDAGGRRLDAGDLTRAGEAWGADFSGLPPGELRDFGDRVSFVPAGILELCRAGGLAAYHWQGLPLGRMRGGAFVPAARGRILLPPASEMPPLRRLDADDPAPVLDLLAGRSLVSDGPAGPVGLYFRGLPLGWLVRKGRRLLWSER